jgi:hypothetical protein
MITSPTNTPNFSQDHIVKESDDNSPLNKYAIKSLAQDNEAKRRSRDEAVSIDIITDKLNTRLSIHYETDIYGFYGKPDFIIKLGRKMFIMVSITRAIHKFSKDGNLVDIFDADRAKRLIHKKITGLSVCAGNVDCLVDEVVPCDNVVRSILHILAPSMDHAKLCYTAYNDMLADMGSASETLTKKIRVIISVIIFKIKHIIILLDTLFFLTD